MNSEKKCSLSDTHMYINPSEISWNMNVRLLQQRIVGTSTQAVLIRVKLFLFLILNIFLPFLYTFLNMCVCASFGQRRPRWWWWISFYIFLALKWTWIFFRASLSSPRVGCFTRILCDLLKKITITFIFHCSFLPLHFRMSGKETRATCQIAKS